MKTNQWPNNIFFIGFMGTGKSSISQLLSSEIGYGLLDTDAEIEKRAGKSISQIFAQAGEAAFREMETNLLRDMVRDEISHFIVSCGGGIIVTPDNVPLMRQMGTIVLLTASVDEIVRRTSRDKKRPLLQTEDPKGRIEELLAKRAHLYEAAADLTISTTGLLPDDVVRQIMTFLQS